MANRTHSPSSIAQAHAEAEAAIGGSAYTANKRLVAGYVEWRLTVKAEANERREAKRRAREQRWRLIAQGALEPLSSSDYGFRESDSPVSETTLADAFTAERLRRNREPAGPRVPRETGAGAPEPTLSLSEAAERTGIAYGTLNQRYLRGALRGWKVKGQGVRIAVAEVERLEAEGCRSDAPLRVRAARLVAHRASLDRPGSRRMAVA